MTQQPGSQGVRFDMSRGPFQNNGASPWYATLALGTPGQSIKLALDSGTNILWTTSTLCAPDRCQHYGGSRFDYSASTSFAFTDTTPQKYSFGPWGTMVVEAGSDVLATPDGASLPIDFFLSQDYSGDQFAGIDWDGGLGIPSGSDQVQPGNSFIVGEMMNSGAISAAWPFVSFCWDRDTKTGNCIIGGYDPSEFIPDEGIFVPWSKYTKLDGVGYIWSTPMQNYAVGDDVIATATTDTPYWFCLDSGSSQFKGDDDIMNKTLALVGSDHQGPPVVITLGDPGSDPLGTLTVDRSMYNAVIQTGPGKGALIAQFQPLGIPQLALVGSIVMESCYTIFAYTVSGSPGSYVLAPTGMWVFNKPGGPKIVAAGGSQAWTGGPQPVGPAPSAVKEPAVTTTVRPGSFVGEEA
jgi:hypothetical protein